MLDTKFLIIYTTRKQKQVPFKQTQGVFRWYHQTFKQEAPIGEK